MDQEADKKKDRRITQPSSATSSPRKSTDSSASSPEFEFWVVRNPSEPQPNILSADQLFVNGVLLPLHLLPQNPLPDSDPDPDPKPDLAKHHPDPSPPESSAVAPSASKRWKDIFKIGDRNASGGCSSHEVLEEKDKEKRKKDKKSFSSSSISSTAADLNINIWPFSRSRSAGNGSSSGRARASAAAARKASSAPCSRSNSAGESKSSKKWPSSPGRAGVHLGRSSPVWQVRRAGKAAEPATARREGSAARRSGGTGGGGGDRTSSSSSSTVRVLNLSVPLCIGYRQHLSCSRDESGFGNPSREDGNVVAAAAPTGAAGNSNSPLFNLRTLFSKKVH